MVEPHLDQPMLQRHQQIDAPCHPFAADGHSFGRRGAGHQSLTQVTIDLLHPLHLFDPTFYRFSGALNVRSLIKNGLAGRNRVGVIWQLLEPGRDAPIPAAGTKLAAEGSPSRFRMYPQTASGRWNGFLGAWPGATFARGDLCPTVPAKTCINVVTQQQIGAVASSTEPVNDFGEVMGTRDIQQPT